MGSQEIGDRSRKDHDRRPGADSTQQVNAQEMLAELKRLLESAERPPFAPRPSSPSASTGLAQPSGATEPWRSTDFAEGDDSADDFSADGPPRLRSRRRRPAVLALALGAVVLVGACLALWPAADGSKGPLAVVPTPAQSDAQPPAGPAVAASDVGAPLAPANPTPADGGEARSDAHVSTPATPAAIEPQPPAEAAKAEAVALPVDSAPASAAGAASAVPQAALPEPVAGGTNSPDRMASARISSNPADATHPNGIPALQTEAAPVTGAKEESAGPAARTNPPLPTPDPRKKAERKTPAKSEKATAGAIAQAPKPTLSKAPPEKPVHAPAVPAPADPVAAAPAETNLATQTVGRLTQAFDYVTRLPVALIRQSANPGGDGK